MKDKNVLLEIYKIFNNEKFKNTISRSFIDDLHVGNDEIVTIKVLTDNKLLKNKFNDAKNLEYKINGDEIIIKLNHKKMDGMNLLKIFYPEKYQKMVESADDFLLYNLIPLIQIPNIIEFINTSKNTKLISSHDLEFILETCSRVIVIDKGEVVADGVPAEIMNREKFMKEHGLERPHSLMHMKREHIH